MASLPSADSAACWAAIDDLAHRMRGDDPTRTLAQCRADALVDLMLSNVQVATTVTLMIPAQTATTDEPHDGLEHDLLARDLQVSPRPEGCGSEGSGPGSSGPDSATAESALPESAGTGVGTGQPRARLPGEPSYWAMVDDFGQPTPEVNPLVVPTWQQICAMGYEIPGIRVIGGDVVAAILDRFETRIARVLLDETTAVVIETSIAEYLPDKAMRRFVQRRDGCCASPGAGETPSGARPTTSSPSPAGGRPRSGTWSPCANTTTGSNTTPAGT
jgi:hypothetical protein